MVMSRVTKGDRVERLIELLSYAIYAAQYWVYVPTHRIALPVGNVIAQKYGESPIHIPYLRRSLNVLWYVAAIVLLTTGYWPAVLLYIPMICVATYDICRQFEKPLGVNTGPFKRGKRAYELQVVAESYLLIPSESHSRPTFIYTCEREQYDALGTHIRARNLSGLTIEGHNDQEFISIHLGAMVNLTRFVNEDFRPEMFVRHLSTTVIHELCHWACTIEENEALDKNHAEWNPIISNSLQYTMGSRTATQPVIEPPPSDREFEFVDSVPEEVEKTPTTP